MNTPLSWIKAYVPELQCTDQEYVDAMTMSGTKVESYVRLDKNLSKIVVGEILSIEKHKDADKLIVCQVNIGKETVQIVTGASNVKEGDKVPVVLEGGRVAGGHDGSPPPEKGIEIKKGKLRGMESFGMMCSIEELGSTREMYPDAPIEGIYIFPKETKVGEDAIEVLGLHDTVFEHEITLNRVDCYSVLGIAREAAATFCKPFHPPKVEVKGNGENIHDYISVEVEAPDLCSRYCARVCKNIKIGPSPLWMQRRLAASGIRPINNLVDITNYVMEEYGQPMHAFDLDTIEDRKIIVKRAEEGEEFQTLDGQMRKMDRDVLMICDGKKKIGIGGIMGGENSKITENVKTVLFEAATFYGPNIRKSAKRIGLRTDASSKFEKGLDPHRAKEAIDRACALIEELGYGEVVGGMIDVCQPLKEPVRIPLYPEKINKLLGINLSKEEMLGYLERGEFLYEKETEKILVPSFRQDVEGMADLAEEVARFYGYDNIPVSLPCGEATTGKLTFKLRIESVAREVAEFCGFSQAMWYSFESPKVFDKLLLPEDSLFRKAIKIANPLGEDFSIMRTISLNGILTSLATNYNRRNENVRLYEMGNIYLPKQLPLTELPEERMQFTLGMYGEGDFFTMKGVVEEFLQKAGMKKKAKYDKDGGKSFLHPGRQANILYEDSVIGFLGEIHPEVCDNYEMKTKVYIAVLDMPEIEKRASFDRKYTGIAKYPAVTRDISMVMKQEIQAGQIEDIIEQRGGNLLESYKLFDIYEGSQIKEGYKSLAYSITFRAKDRTLEENDVQKAMKKILNGLQQLGIELRQ
ncbi:phenylalanine--tRNA ligase subunit beta [bacterium 1XD42-8]|jgi:phenylalanyl-tRNA synthetase beta chain|nr:phenylalanine--tRNA ligase subunit beta [Lachnospiraceae bacterium]RKJ51418.1 phenylalanine--tRNA ligase subunit beta [bacterium 1XD42-8]